MCGLLFKTLFLLAGLASLGDAFPHLPASYGQDHSRNSATTGKAVYFITNDVENSVVALSIGKSGKLSMGSVTKTGGTGSTALNAATQQPAVPDALVGQSALTVAGNVSHPYLNIYHGSMTSVLLMTPRMCLP
jgi:hypothetical protein